MKNSITLLCFYIFSNFTFSQATITGKIVDSNNNPLDAAAISLLSDSNQFIKAAVSTSKGFFKIANVKNGTYYLKIESLGFKVYKSDKIIVTNDKNLNTIQLTSDTEQLEEVVIKTEKPMVQVLADKTVFNVQNSINAAGDSGFDLLRKAPGVVIDNNDNLIIEGKNGVLFYIDGKPSVLRGEDLVNFLKTLQSSDIDL